MLDIIAIIISISAFALSCITAYMSLCNFRYQLYLDFHKYYTTKEMDTAIRDIWDFAREIISKNLHKPKNKLSVTEISNWLNNENNKNNFKEEYTQIVKKEGSKKIKFSNIRISRRLVTQYYFHITSTYVRSKSFSKKSFFDWHAPEDLIIFDILKPLEEAEAKGVGGTINDIRIRLRHFDMFRTDCINYYKMFNSIYR